MTNVAPTAAMNSGAKNLAMLVRLASLVKPSTVMQKTADVRISTGSIGDGLEQPERQPAECAHGRREPCRSPPLPDFARERRVMPTFTAMLTLSSTSAIVAAQPAQPQILGAIVATSSGP